ncbi:MAG TPA: putative 4-mercaptohistidine N1-methyltransferase [Verrucomicrobiales bacterium]|nr:putative 4-mercaptohistidine N1-methyltransferase [Verrucomicrobiales bacterium]
MNIYETPRLVSEYLLFHYGSSEEILPWPGGPSAALHFPVRVVRELFRPGELPPGPRALELGCAVGRSSLELSRFCDEVAGIDFSSAFIDAAESVARSGALPYLRTDEGRLTTPLVARPPDGTRPGKVRFQQGDAMDLPGSLGAFDAVLAANLLCRLPQPDRLLSRLPNLVRAHGQLVLTTPCTWLEEFTPRQHWLGGFQDGAGRAVATLEGLTQALSPAFELVETRDLPFLIREHARKYQWNVAQGSLWKRRGPGHAC